MTSPRAVSDGFSFLVAYNCTRCCDCPNFRSHDEYSPQCLHMLAGGHISEALNNDYYSTIHEDCPERPDADSSEEND